MTMTADPRDFIHIHSTDDGPTAVRLLVEAVKYEPHGARKVLLVESPERLSLGARSALGKVLEDPPYFLEIVLVTADADFA